MKKSIKNLCLSAVMAALYFALDYFPDKISFLTGGQVKITLSGIAILVVAAYCGPLWGAATGLVGAFLIQLVSSYGLTATTPLWVLPHVLRGLVFGLLFIAIKRRVDFLWLLIPTLASAIVVTAANTFALYIDSKIYHYPAALFGMTLVGKLISGAIVSVIFALMLPEILKLIKRVIKE